jgi:tetratricopeptide (TPR) repeat protein
VVAALFIAGAQAFGQAKPPNAALLMKHAMEIRTSGDLPGALKELRRAATLNPTLPGVHREIGLILIEQREFESASGELRSAIRDNPQDYSSRYNLALCLANANHLPEALDEARHLVRMGPRWSTGFYGLGHIEALAGDKRAAIQSFRVAVHLDKQAYRAWFELGKLLEDAGDKDAAVQAFEQAIQAQPNFAAARYRLAVLLRNAGDSASASAEFAAARDIQQEQARGEQAARAYSNGVDLLEKKNFAAAIAELERAHDLRPDFNETRGAIAEAEERWGASLEQAGQPNAAIGHYRHAVEMAPSAEIQNHVGVLLAKRGELEEAIRCFQAALALDPKFQNARNNLNFALDVLRKSK